MQLSSRETELLVVDMMHLSEKPEIYLVVITADKRFLLLNYESRKSIRVCTLDLFLPSLGQRTPFQHKCDLLLNHH